MCALYKRLTVCIVPEYLIHAFRVQQVSMVHLESLDQAAQG